MTTSSNAMMTHETVPAHLWDGQKKIRGTLLLTAHEVVFELEDFGKSHLDLRIPLSGIIQVTSFLIFDQARKGLKIVSKNEVVDLFVLEDPLSFRNAIMVLLDHCAS